MSETRTFEELGAELAANPDSMAFVALAAAHRERELQRALAVCLRGLQRHPTHVEAHFELGQIYEERNERELALDEWAIVRQLAPDHLPSRLAAVALYLEEGRYGEARRELQAAERLTPGDARLAGLRDRLETAAGSAETVTAPVPQDAFADLLAAGDAIFGVLLVDAEGRVGMGRLLGDSQEAERSFGANMRGARREAERVVSYLDLGGFNGLEVQSGERRVTAAPLGERTVVVVTGSRVPAGRAIRALQQAMDIAEAQSGEETG